MSSSEVLSKIRSLTGSVADKALTEKERAEAFVKLVREGNKITDIEYAGHRIRDDPDFLEQKKLANQLFDDLTSVYSGTVEPVFGKYLEVTDEDYVVSLWQATSVASSYNQQSSGLDEFVRVWFILGLYASAYELACKVLTPLAKNLFATDPLSCGDARSLFKERLGGKYSQVGDYFDNFLRNAIDHSQYIFNEQTGSIDAWDVKDRSKTSKQQYKIEDTFKKTVKLLFLIVSLYVVFNERLEKELFKHYGLTM